MKEIIREKGKKNCKIMSYY